MVSGLVTSPEDHPRICLLDASPISMASKLLMSIMKFLGWWSYGEFSRRASGLVLHDDVLGEVAEVDLGVDFEVRGLVLGHGLGLVVGHVGVVGALDGLVGRLTVAGADAGQVDAELLGGAQQVVVLVGHLGPLALL